MKRSLDDVIKMKSQTDRRTAAVSQPTAGGAHGAGGGGMGAKYLKQPVKPERAFGMFLTQACKAARNFLPKEMKYPITRPFCEVECRVGVLKAPFGVQEMRVTSSGPKHVPGAGIAAAFKCDHIEPRCSMESGVSRSDFSHWTQAGLSEVSPISRAFGVTDVQLIKRDLQETEYIETVYAGYPEDRRVCFPGLHPPPAGSADGGVIGKMEYKDKLCTMDLAIPAAGYDARITLSAEKSLDSNVRNEPPQGWTSKRVKRRRSYSRRDDSFAWQLDVTEVTTTANHNKTGHSDVTYEIEMEIMPKQMLQLVNEFDDQKVQSMAEKLGQQLWWMLQQINPLSDVADVEDYLKNHPSAPAVRLAMAQCAALKTYLDQQKSNPNARFTSPIGSSNGSSAAPPSHFMGCMPVNFSRHNIEEIQRSPDNAYFCSEKTDGVRHFLVFTGDTTVLVDRALRGKQPIPTGSNSNSKDDPMQHLLSLIAPGTVLDGEVVMNRKYKRPIFIVFDVMCSGSQPVLQLPFEHRLQHLRRATFRTPDAKRDMFDPKDVTNPNVALPLVRKNFVHRTDLPELLSNVVEERGMRCYRNGDLHNHLTDGIIFQPNLPYVCGTDTNLLKWKYLDTVTIDVQLLPPRHGMDDDDVLRVGCMGEEGTTVDMSRYVHLPRSERLRLEADRNETGGKIAEVGFDPETGEWYYLTMRSDKVAPNHISTVLGTLLELAESLTTEELIYRMSIPAGGRDNYRKDFRGMLKQLLEFQKKKMKTAASSSSSSHSHR